MRKYPEPLDFKAIEEQTDGVLRVVRVGSPNLLSPTADAIFQIKFGESSHTFTEEVMQKLIDQISVAQICDYRFKKHDVEWATNHVHFPRTLASSLQQTVKIGPILIVSENPIYEERDANNLLHCSTGPSCEWANGYKLFHLNGVSCPEWLVVVPSAHLHPSMIQSVINAQHRAEFIRKVGLERCLSYLHYQILDKQGDYELIAVEVIRGTEIWLKMLNPSVGIWHLEAVHPICRTVQHALNWRAYQDIEKEWKPESIT